MRTCAGCGGPWRLRRFMNAYLCASCAPVVPVPDPARTMTALASAHQRSMRAIVHGRHA